MERATELEFLRYYRKFAKAMFEDGGTDEDYWICDAFIEETGKQLPDGYGWIQRGDE